MGLFKLPDMSPGIKHTSQCHVPFKEEQMKERARERGLVLPRERSAHMATVSTPHAHTFTPPQSMMVSWHDHSD